jgi:hypothetical protein
MLLVVYNIAEKTMKSQNKKNVFDKSDYFLLAGMLICLLILNFGILTNSSQSAIFCKLLNISFWRI